MPIDDLSPAYPGRAAWGTAARLRAWQVEALSRYRELGQRDFLAVATPGAGKTTFGCVWRPTCWRPARSSR